MSSVNVTVETSTDNQIIEVSYDGHETVQPPLTLSEHLAKQATKINFDEVDAEDEEGANGEANTGDPPEGAEDVGSSDSSEDEEGGAATVWPWESTRNKLRDALTELSVLADVISVATKPCGVDPQGNPRRYMYLDGPSQVQKEEPNPMVTFLAKKKSLEAPSKILLQGAENLKKCLQQDPKDSNQKTPDFHLELLKLRQNWRLKKVSHTILGDLSYRTAGSHFKQSGVFEVVKADSMVSAPNASSSSAPTPSAENKAPESSLRVNVPSDLEGVAYIQVIIQKEQDLLSQATLTNPADHPSNNNGGSGREQDTFWQKKLEDAQNVLFCKELFSQLAKEAIQLQAPIPHMVVGNQITASLFPDIQLLITLCHSTPPPKLGASLGGCEKMEHPPTPSHAAELHSHVLEHSLYQLLRTQHQKNIDPDQVGLSTAPVGISKRRRMAGPSAASRKDLLEMAESETLLEQIIRQAQHILLRQRVAFVLDTMARDLKDPLISCHWGTITSPQKTSVKVCITTSGYDAIISTKLVIHVGEKEITVICKDGRVLHFSHEPQELRDFILCQIAQHQINGVQALAKCTGWQMLSSSTYQLGCGVVEPLGNAVGCLIGSPSGDKFIAVRHGSHGPTTGVTVYVSSAPCKDFFVGSVVKDKRWENLPESFTELRLDKMDGKNLLTKLELLMAAMSASTMG